MQIARRPRHVTVSISPKIYDALQALARRRGRLVPAYLSDFIDEYGSEWIEEASSIEGTVYGGALDVRPPGMRRRPDDVSVRTHVRRRTK